MKYNINLISLNELIELIKTEKLDLNPPYQRNFIWSANDQKSLIETILQGWPLPNFFIYIKKDGKMEMVDGQQRSKSIFRFCNGEFNTSKEFGNLYFKDINQNEFLSYEIPVVFIESTIKENDLRNFYVLINKKGKHLNTAEVQRSEFMNTNFMKLADNILSNQKLIYLDLFTDASAMRLNDRDFIQELLGYLQLGIKDKKTHINDIFENDIDDEEYKKLQSEFETVLDKLIILDNLKKLNRTRYKQKNDFYTLFTFINKYKNLEIEILKYQYKILILLDGKDGEGRQLIRPTNNDCLALKNYALNCVSQSNSKFARESRLKFFECILLNQSEDNLDSELIDVLNYLTTIFGNENIELKNVSNYYLLDVELLTVQK